MINMKQFHVKSRGDLLRDLWTGFVIALLSIPLSMGYAQVAGLPPQYGLYGSFLPILIFSLFTSSPRLVFGVDAAPAAIVSTLLPHLGIEPGSADAVSMMSVITALVAIWLFIFYLIRGGRFAKFVSEPVLGGCVTGIAVIVILTQIPRLFGGVSTSGRAPVLIAHLIGQFKNFNLLSCVLGVSTVAFILICRKYFKMSLSVIVMAFAIAGSMIFDLKSHGVEMVSAIASGTPNITAFYHVDFSHIAPHMEALLIDTLAVALVIAAETLVSTNEIGRKYGDEIDNQRELLAYAGGNFMAALCWSSPVIGSLSRTNRANKLGVTSQWMSVAACVTMGLFLFFASPLLNYFPVPVLTGIVIASLSTILEISVATHLWKIDRPSFFIFIAAFLAEMLGLAEGVLVGVVLSFAAFTMRASSQPGYFLGCMEGHDGFFDLSQTPHARPIEQTILYQFNGPLFFATVGDFERDIFHVIKPDTNLIIVTGVASVDLFAAERLRDLYKKLRKRDILFFMAGHAAAVNQHLMAYGAAELIYNGAVRQRLTQALIAGGLTPPYPLEPDESEWGVRGNAAIESFYWAYGEEAEARLGDLSRRLVNDILSGGDMDWNDLNLSEMEVAGEFWNHEDEKEFFSLLEMTVAISDPDERKKQEKSLRAMTRELLEHRIQLERQLMKIGDMGALQDFERFRMKRDAELLNRYPDAAGILRRQQQWYLDALYKEDAELAGLIQNMTKEKVYI